MTGQPPRANAGLPKLNDPDPTLTDGAVLLRRWTIQDIGRVRAASEEGRIPEYTSVPERFTQESGRAWIRRQQGRSQAGDGWPLAIADAQTGEALGRAAPMLRPQAGVAGIGYWLVPESRGRGHAARAVGLLTDWGLGAGGLERIEAWVEPGNEASVRVLAGCGFGYEGRLRSFLSFPTRRADALVFSRLRGSEPRARARGAADRAGQAPGAEGTDRPHGL